MLNYKIMVKRRRVTDQLLQNREVQLILVLKKDYDYRRSLLAQPKVHMCVR